MIVDALVGMGYPFGELRRMTFSELTPWLEVAMERVQRAADNGGA